MTKLVPTMSSRWIVFALLACLACSAIAGEYRVWTTANGRRSDVKLKLVEQSATTVKLERADNGKLVELPIDQLSADDQKYLSESTSSGQVASDHDVYQRVVRPHMQTYCFRCHGEAKQESDLRLDTLEPDFSQSRIASRWLEIMHRINAGEMPPSDEPQPKAEELTRMVVWIAGSLHRQEVRGDGPRTVVRRLTRSQYNNTLRDLLGIDLRPADVFPEDPPAHGFDHIGAAQHVSPLQIEQYIGAARWVLDRAIVAGSKPKSIEWHFEAEEFVKEGVGHTHRRDWEGNQVRIAVESVNAEQVQDGMLVLLPQQGHAGARDMRFPEGEYVIRVRAAADIPSRAQVIHAALELARKSPDSAFEVERFRQHYEQDLLYQYGPPRMRIVASMTSQLLAELDVDAPSGKPQVHTVRVRLSAGKNGVRISNNYNLPGIYQIHRVSGAGLFPRPRLLVDWIEIEGPVVDDWPLASHQRILFPSDARDDERKYAHEILARFMRRAWRRPISAAEIDRKLALFDRTRSSSANFEEAIKLPLIAVLSSPHFLYLLEPEPAAAPGIDRPRRALNDYDLATRLSYFLWSSMPDEELFGLASQGRLAEESVLIAQADRLLKDPKCRAFAQDFGGQWLGLRRVGANPPSPDLFRRYDAHLQESMVRESEGFVAEVLRRDLDVLSFLKSDFVTINERLARFYGIAGVRGDEIRRVAVPPGIQRGGLITQGSVLTITSNGTRTSPVLRGKWILDNLLDDPPPPPPPNAGEIAQQVPGLDKVTVRERLEIHRKVSACAACHQKIDPLGFALENFRADGSWAAQEANGWHGYIEPSDPSIDARALLPDGSGIDGVAELQQALLAREEQFLRCLTKKLATYALARPMLESDRAWLNEMVENMRRNGRTLRGLIKDIVRSEQFRTL